MLELRKIVKPDLRTYFALKVLPEQNDLVSPNEITLAQAAYETGSYVWGLWEGDTAVGMIAMIHPRESDDLDEGDDPDAAYVWRLMVGAEHQGKGFGKQALLAAINQAANWGLPRICLTVADEAHSAIEFYENLGFVKTGRVVDTEIELIRDI
ncbi:MAG: GNAT family N-acetyltransferase [Paracoccaceae bacterium]